VRRECTEGRDTSRNAFKRSLRDGLDYACLDSIRAKSRQKVFDGQPLVAARTSHTSFGGRTIPHGTPP